MRDELIKEYLSIYYDRTNTIKFRQNYDRMSELWINFTDEERRVVNKNLTTDMMWD